MSMPPPPPPATGDQPPQWQQPVQQQQWPTAPQQWQVQQQPTTVKVGSAFAWLALLAALAVAVGSGLNWIDLPGDVFDISGFGTEDEAKDGVLTIALAIIAGILILLGGIIKIRVLHIIGAVFMALAAAIGWIDVADINDSFGDTSAIGIGLWIVAIGASVGTIFAIIAAVQTRKRPVGYS